jgi:hypothetical protein
MNSIGIVEHISVGGYKDVPAKIDTGADASSVWASKISVDKEGVLRFTLFGEGSPHYTGKTFKRTDFGVARVKSSNGVSQLRYRTHLTIDISGRRIRVLFYLADRSTQKFSVIIGRRTIAGRFVVDVAKNTDTLQQPRTVGLNEELKKDPYGFHRKYMRKEHDNGK